VSSIKVGISGSLGRMGKEIINKISKDSRLNFIGGFDKKDKKNYLNKIFKNSKVVIDFSSAKAIKQNLSFAIKHNTGLVIGTTGLDKKEIKQLKSASRKIPILLSSNMSLGVNLLFNLVQQTASVLGKDAYDIEIAETHHKHKKDAPSGTALSLGEYASIGRKAKLNKMKVLDRTKNITSRQKGQIGFSVTRGGEIAGEHTVSFIGSNDRIDLVHKASNRSIFVDGAIDAAIFLSKKKKGFFNMKDLF
tara:strand:- start:657 stop:1400 length:744 start_codon:yes stop_codon:yes gene_type:complete